MRWMGEQAPDLEGQGGCVTPSYGHQKCPGLPVPGPALRTSTLMLDKNLPNGQRLPQGGGGWRSPDLELALGPWGAAPEAPPSPASSVPAAVPRDLRRDESPLQRVEDSGGLCLLLLRVHGSAHLVAAGLW